MTTSNLSIQDIESTFRLLKRHNPFPSEEREKLELAVAAFADVLEHRNTAFDREEFYRNCEEKTP